MHAKEDKYLADILMTVMEAQTHQTMQEIMKLILSHDFGPAANTGL